MTNEKPTAKLIRSVIRRSIRWDADITFVAGQVNISDISLVFHQLRPMSTIRPLEMDIVWGLGELPLDADEIEIYLLVTRQGVGVSTDSANARAYWGDMQHWESVNPSANVLTQTLDHKVLDFFNAKPTSNVALAERAQNLVLGMAVGGDQALTLTTIIRATLHFEEIMIQRNWKSDDYTWHDYDQQKGGTSANEEEVCCWGS